VQYTYSDIPSMTNHSRLKSSIYLNAAEPQTENRSKNGIHPPEWLVITVTCLGRMPWL